MIIVLTGAPGAGKGTQADMLVKNCGFRKLSTGDALRRQISQGTDIGLLAKEYMDNGNLVPDEVLLKILNAELGNNAKEKILLDGYPRNLEQAKTLDGLDTPHEIKGVVLIDVDQGAILNRIIGRRVCGSCGASFHVETLKPRVDDVCDNCGSGLIQRPDDTKEKVSVRLNVYNEVTKPIIGFYKEQQKFFAVDGNGGTEDVYNRLLETVSRISK
jgi:adenylate kinase